MKVKQLTKYITSNKDRTPVRVKVLIDNWYLCEFTCLRGNISNFNNRTAAEFYDDYDKVFTLKNILGATVIGIEPLMENTLSIEVDINEIYDFKESLRRNRSIKEGRTMPYVLWVLDGDTRQWEMYKGVDDAKQFIRDNDYDEFLDALNTQVFPNETYYNNYIDWVVIPAGEEPRKFDTHKFYNSLKYESMRRLGEGNASLKTNYAVIVYDMNTGSYNLYTGTKKMCEQLYKDLFDFNIDDYDDDEKDDMYDWLHDRLNEFNCIERIDFRRGIDYRDNYSDGYDKYHIINYTKPRHPISLYL